MLKISCFQHSTILVYKKIFGGKKMKKVVYNGGTESCYGCTEPTALVVGQQYEVTSEEVRSWQTNYTLKGIEGSFNSAWFDDEPEEKKFFIAVAKTIPAVGKPYTCHKVEFVDSEPRLISCRTTNVVAVTCLGETHLQVETKNSIYFVNVDC